MPWLTDIIIEGEDILSLNWNSGSGDCGEKLRVAS